MALLDSEIRRIRAELGVNILTVDAEPYIGVTQLFEQVIQQNVTAGAVTTSSTVVTGSGSPAAVTLTLASATGFNSGDRVIVDVDSLQESATAQNVTGSTVTLLLSLSHSGTYPVTVEGGESLIRAKLKYITTLTGQIQTMATAAGIKSADSGEVEFFSARDSRLKLGPVGALWEQREWEREELAELLGTIYPRKLQRDATQTASIY